MRKVVLIGDLRKIHNYGAIATSTALIRMLKCVDNIELKILDMRNGYDIGNQIPIKYFDYYSYAQKAINHEILCYETTAIEWADIVIVNSEGNIVSGTDAEGVYRPGGLYVLFLEWFAKTVCNKSTYVINHTVDPHNNEILNRIKEIYPLLDGVYVREKLSLDLLIRNNILNVKKVPDALWSYDFSGVDYSKLTQINRIGIDFSKPYICIGDSSGIFNRFGEVKWDVYDVYTKIISYLRTITEQIVWIDGFNGGHGRLNDFARDNNVIQVNLNNCSFETLYLVFKRSIIFVSGRWHASIIALMAGCPICLWGADSHKTKALYGEIDYPYPFFNLDDLPDNLEELYKTIFQIINDKTKLDLTWTKVREQRILAVSNVDFLN